MGTIHAKLAAVTKLLGEEGIRKGGTNTYHDYKYRTIEQLLEALNQALSAQGLHLSITTLEYSLDVIPEPHKSGVDYVGVYKALFGFTFYSAEDGSSVTDTVPILHMGKDHAKLAGQALSYTLKSVAFTRFSIPVPGEQDVDALPPLYPTTTPSKTKKRAKPTSNATPSKTKTRTKPTSNGTSTSERSDIMLQLIDELDLEIQDIRKWAVEQLGSDKKIEDLTEAEWEDFLTLFKSTYGGDS